MKENTYFENVDENILLPIHIILCINFHNIILIHQFYFLHFI